jgi:hypothetical protein
MLLKSKTIQPLLPNEQSDVNRHNTPLRREAKLLIVICYLVASLLLLIWQTIVNFLVDHGKPNFDLLCASLIFIIIAFMLYSAISFFAFKKAHYFSSNNNHIYFRLCYGFIWLGSSFKGVIYSVLLWKLVSSAKTN